MKIFVVYDTENESDIYEFEKFKKMRDAFIFIHDFETQLRQWTKYSEKEPTLEQIRDRYYEIKHKAFESEVI